MVPPRPAVIAHGKVLRVPKTAAANSCRECLPVFQVVRSASPTCASGSFTMSLVCAWRERNGWDPAWRHSGKELPFPYCYGSWIDYRLLMRRQRAHRRRFARSPRFRYRAGLKIVGAADVLRNTLSGKTRNEIDSHSRHLKTWPRLTPRASCSQAPKQVYGFVHRFENATPHVTILRHRQKFFTKASRARLAGNFSKCLSTLCR